MSRKKPKLPRSHGQGTVYPHPRVPVGSKRAQLYAIRWPESGRRRFEGGFVDEDKARQALDLKLARIRCGEPSTPVIEAPKPRTDHTFAELLEDFRESRKTRCRVAAEDVWRWDRHLGRWSDRKVTSIEARHIHELVGGLLRPDPAERDGDGKRLEAVSGPTAKRVLHLLSAFYRWAIRMKYAAENPVKGEIRELAKELKSTYTPDPDAVLQDRATVVRLYRAIPATYVTGVRGPKKTRSMASPAPIAYLLSAWAGLRPGEVYPLCWSDVSLSKKSISVRYSYRNGVLGLPKSGKPRTVPIPDFLGAELLAWRTLHPDAQLVCPPLRQSKRGQHCFIGSQFIQGEIEKGCEAAGIPVADFYDLGRRTFATIAARKGLPLPRLQKILGHASVETTMRYVRLGELDEAEALALNAV